MCRHKLTAPDWVYVESYERMEFDFDDGPEPDELDKDEAHLAYLNRVWPWNDESLGGAEDPRNHFEFQDIYQNPFILGNEPDHDPQARYPERPWWLRVIWGGRKQQDRDIV
jgi:hypothetical protein